MVCWGQIGMLPEAQLDPRSETPLYRQLYTHVRHCIDSGLLRAGDRLPPTRDLAGQLGLNRTTVSAAWALLESDGLIRGHVGRGSFVVGGSPTQQGIAWSALLPEPERQPAVAPARFSFAASRPSELLFPTDAFRQSCEEVIRSEEARVILQLGSPAGYRPLREFLVERGREEGIVGDGDDVMITSGIQQAFDLLQRVLVANGETVITEDPGYTGLTSVLRRGGARLIGIATAEDGIDLQALERTATREKPRMIVITSNFQNPTGATLSSEAREKVLAIVRGCGAVLVENDSYGDLVYEGPKLPSIRQLDDRGDTVLLRSFSKLAFPGLRTGWVIGPRPLIARLTEAKQVSDLHTDQLSQAVLLRFAASGRLAEHCRRVLEEGGRRLGAAIAACEQFLPSECSFTRPRGGMNLWIRLPRPLDAGELLARAERDGVNYLPGRVFAVSGSHAGALRLSFAALAPAEIRAGIEILSRIFSAELDRVRRIERLEPAPAFV